MSDKTKPPIRERLRSALNRELPREPAQPEPTFSPWESPNPEEIESGAQQRIAGAIAWSERTVPDPPQFGRQDL